MLPYKELQLKTSVFAVGNSYQIMVLIMAPAVLCGECEKKSVNLIPSMVK